MHMVYLSHFLFVLLCTSLFLLYLWRRSHAPSSRKRPPPSPPKLPGVGNLHQMSSLPHRSLQSLSSRYGPLMLLHFGKVPVLIASSAEAAREIMKKQDLIFSNRPQLSIPGRLFYNNRDVVFAPYGEYWRRIRSICVLHLLSSKRVQSYRRVREEETSLMVERLGSSSTAPVNLRDVVASMTNDVISMVALGKKSGGGERNFHKIIAELEELMGVVPVWEYIPWPSWMRRFDGVDGRIERVARALDEFLETVIQEHRVRERRESDGGELDFVDILLDFQRENGSGSSVDDNTIKAIILDMYVGGTDTTATTLEWTMTELIKNPATMKTLQNEVREVVGNKAEIDEKDRENALFKSSDKGEFETALTGPIVSPS